MSDTLDPGCKDYLEYMRTVLKGKQDPVWFVKDILGVNLFPKQELIIRTFYQYRYDPNLNKYKKLICVAGMRGGKTALASMMSVYEFWDLITLENPAAHYGLLKNQPIFISTVAPSEDQALDGVFGNVSRMIEMSEWFSTWVDLKIKMDKVVCEPKNVTIRTLSSFSTTAVGRSNKCLTLDELANFEETTGKRGAYEVFSRLSKSTDTFGLDGHIIGISSTRDPNDIIMTQYKNGLQETHTLALLIPTWELNPNISEESLREEYKYDMGSFYRDCACQPEMYSGVQFPEGVALKRMPNVLKDLSLTQTTDIHVAAMDPAVRNDAFGFATGYKTLAGRPVVDGVYKFEKTSGEGYIKPSDVQSFMFKAFKKLNVGVLVSDTWGFPEIIENSQKQMGIQFVKHIVRKEDYDRWRELQGSNQVDVVYDEWLEREASRLMIKDGNVPKVDHPFGGSKDLADCVANVIWFLTTQELASQLPNLVLVKAF